MRGKFLQTPRSSSCKYSLEISEEKGLYRYTVGSSTNYNEIYRLRKQLLDKFPESFIIAYKNGKIMDVNKAIAEFRKRRK